MERKSFGKVVTNKQFGVQFHDQYQGCRTVVARAGSVQGRERGKDEKKYRTSVNVGSML